MGRERELCLGLSEYSSSKLICERFGERSSVPTRPLSREIPRSIVCLVTGLLHSGISYSVTSVRWRIYVLFPLLLVKAFGFPGASKSLAGFESLAIGEATASGWLDSRDSVERLLLINL